MTDKVKVLPKDYQKKREELASKRLAMKRNRVEKIQFQRELEKINSEFGGAL